MVLARHTRRAALVIASSGACLAILSLLLAPSGDARLIAAAVGLLLMAAPVAVRAARVHRYGDVSVSSLVVLFGAAAFTYVRFRLGPGAALSAFECAVAVVLAGALAGLAFGRASAGWAAVLVAGAAFLQRSFDLPFIASEQAALVAFALLALPLGAGLGALLPGGAVRALGAAAVVTTVACVWLGASTPTEAVPPGPEAVSVMDDRPAPLYADRSLAPR